MMTQIINKKYSNLCGEHKLINIIIILFICCVPQQKLKSQNILRVKTLTWENPSRYTLTGMDFSHDSTEILILVRNQTWTIDLLILDSETFEIKKSTSLGIDLCGGGGHGWGRYEAGASCSYLDGYAVNLQGHSSCGLNGNHVFVLNNDLETIDRVLLKHSSNYHHAVHAPYIHAHDSMISGVYISPNRYRGVPHFFQLTPDFYSQDSAAFKLSIDKNIGFDTANTRKDYTVGHNFRGQPIPDHPNGVRFNSRKLISDETSGEREITTLFYDS